MLLDRGVYGCGLCYRIQCRRMGLRGMTLSLLTHVMGYAMRIGGLGLVLRSFDQAAVPLIMCIEFNVLH